MVKAKEFTAVTKDNIGYDLVEDIYQFMLNDNVFFRKHFFPVAKQVSDSQMTEKDANIWNPCVDQAIKEYFKKFKIKAKPEKIISVEDRQSLVSKIKKGLTQHPVKNAQ